MIIIQTIAKSEVSANGIENEQIMKELEPQVQTIMNKDTEEFFSDSEVFLVCLANEVSARVNVNYGLDYATGLVLGLLQHSQNYL